MEVNGLNLPLAFTEAIRKGVFHKRVHYWFLRKDVDAYGNPLESGLGDVFTEEEAIIRETNELPKHFASDGYYGAPSEWQNAPGYIPDIVDFSKIICFGFSGDGAPFCFDYRDDINNPSVIWWADAYWRRIAPDYSRFIALFDSDEDE